MGHSRRILEEEEEDGKVICAGAGGQLSHLKDAFQAEISACMQGAKAAADHGMGRVILETSASLVLSIAMKIEE